MSRPVKDAPVGHAAPQPSTDAFEDLDQLIGESCRVAGKPLLRLALDCLGPATWLYLW